MITSSKKVQAIAKYVDREYKRNQTKNKPYIDNRFEEHMMQFVIISIIKPVKYFFLSFAPSQSPLFVSIALCMIREAESILVFSRSMFLSDRTVESIL